MPKFIMNFADSESPQETDKKGYHKANQAESPKVPAVCSDKNEVKNGDTYLGKEQR